MQNDENVITNINDDTMLSYLIRESGKTKEEIATEIRERFWSYNNLDAFFAQPS